MTFATESHHCYRLAKHKAVPLDHQYQYCLNENHIRCPVFLRGDRLFPKVAKTQLPTAQPTPVSRTLLHLSLPKSAIKYVITVATILVLVFISWWAITKTDIFTRPDPPVHAFGDLPPGVTPTITREVQEFSPNQTLIQNLTITATGNSQLSQAIPVTGMVTSSLTETSTSTPSPTALACSLPDGWVVYTVKLWDTLYWLSLSVRSSVDELVEVNCLSSQTLIVGQELYLPYYPPKASFTTSQTSTPTDPPPTRTYTATSTPTPTFTFTPVTPTNTTIIPTDVPPTLIATTEVPPTEVPPTEVPPTPIDEPPADTPVPTVDSGG